MQDRKFCIYCGKNAERKQYIFIESMKWFYSFSVYENLLKCFFIMKERKEQCCFLCFIQPSVVSQGSLTAYLSLIYKRLRRCLGNGRNIVPTKRNAILYLSILNARTIRLVFVPFIIWLLSGDINGYYIWLYTKIRIRLCNESRKQMCFILPKMRKKPFISWFQKKNHETRRGKEMALHG